MTKHAWPDWLVEAICKAYKNGHSAAMIGQAIDRSEPVIRSKLVREGVYISKEMQRKQLVAEMPEGF